MYDTSLPTIVPTSIASTQVIVPAPQTIADAPAGAREREAFAMLPMSAVSSGIQRKNAGTKTPTANQNRQETPAGIQGGDGAPPATWLVWRQLLVRAAGDFGAGCGELPEREVVR